jgi:hypothetical protein
MANGRSALTDVIGDGPAQDVGMNEEDRKSCDQQQPDRDKNPCCNPFQGP